MLHFKDNNCGECGKSFSSSFEEMNSKDKIAALSSDTVTCSCGRGLTRFDGSRYLDVMLCAETENIVIVSSRYKLAFTPDLREVQGEWKTDRGPIGPMHSFAPSWGEWEVKILRTDKLSIIGELPVWAVEELDRTGWINLGRLRRRLEDLIRKSPHALLAAMRAQIGS